MTQELQVKLLGAPLRITHAGAALTIKRKARALLYYLMVTGRKHERTAILSLLWSEKPKENAANNLRVTLNHLRRHLDGYLSVDRWSIGFNSEMPYWLDVETLKTLLRAPLDTAECLHAIDRLYQGPFLDGFQLAGGSGFHAWVAAQRQELHHRVTQTLHSLALLYKEQENYPAAIVCGLRLLKQEPWREETHRLLMSVYARTGQRSEALNQYRICRQVLEERENRTPAPETGLLYREILASRAERQQQTVLIEPLHCCKDTDDIAEIVERRHVTLMFCQWRTGEAENYSDHPGVVFQPPVQPVQPREFDKLEAWLAQRRQSRQICIKAIERNGGEFIQETGSGLLAAFACSRGGGARRSVQAGLSILESFAVITEGHVPTVGIHRGLIIMETTAIAGDRQQVRIMGEAVERVETIARRALPRTLSICAAVYALIKGFFECTRVQERKNGSLIYRVLKESNADNRLEAALACHHDLTPWINRRHEFDYLLSQWEQVLKGMPSAVLIQGGQGIGKSRLVRRLMDRISQGSSNTLMLKCQCTDSCRHDFFYPIARQLQRRLNSHAVPPADQAGYVAKLLGRYLKAYAQTELKKLAAEFMNLSGDTDAPIKAEIMREDVINVILAALREASRQRPVLLAVEDVQWADAGSLRLLHSLLEPSFQKSCKYLHTVLTVLPGQESVCPEYPHIGLLKLMPLSSEETEKLLDKLLDGKAVRPGIREQIAAYSDGVPLFAEQLALAWAKLSAADELENLLVPPLLYDLLFAPLDESGSAKKIARLGAVLGREFDYASLRAAWPGDEAGLLAGLSKLTDSQVIYSRGQMPGTIYRFNCALTQVAAYQSLLKRQIDEVRATQ